MFHVRILERKNSRKRVFLFCIGKGLSLNIKDEAYLCRVRRIEWYVRIRRRPFFIFLFWEVGPSSDHKTLMQCYIRQFQSFVTSLKHLKQLLEQVITESLQNKKEFEESSKKEGGGDAKHVCLFTWPYTNKMVSCIDNHINRNSVKC